MKLQHLTFDRARRSTGGILSRAAPEPGAARFPRLRRLLQKVDLFTAKGLAYHQTYARWRLQRALSRWGEGTALPDVRGLASKLDLARPALAPVAAAAAQPDDSALAQALASYLRTRTAPRFFFTPATLEATLAQVEMLDSTGRDQTIQAADQVCDQTFTFRRAAPVHFDGPIDWTHTPAGNTDWMWDLNRHTYFESLGRAYWYTRDARYLAKLGELAADWLARNPAAVDQPAWASVFEVGLRINTWLWALHLVRHAPDTPDETLVNLLAGLWTHGHFLDTHIELHAQNNHLLLEAKALAMLGILLPEFHEAARWRSRGLELFYREVQEQVHPDGVHGERASLYHRIIAGELLELVVLAEANDMAVPPEITHRLQAMVEYELWLTKPDGLVPLIGDSALEDVHLRFAGIRGGPVYFAQQPWQGIAPPPREAEIWLLGPERIRAAQEAAPAPVELGSRAFAHGGIYILRSGQGPEASYALFNCGPFGYKHHTIHGHADALSLELYAHGQTWLVDPGVYSTHLGTSWRRFFQGTRAHNTVVVDDLDQSHFLDVRRVYHPAKTQLHQWASNASFDFVAGEHDGYTRLAHPIIHRRQVCFVKPDYWVVVDQLEGEGEHTFDLYFHLWPGLDVHTGDDAGALRVTNAAGAGLEILPVGETSTLECFVGETDPIQGWVGLYSGEKLAAPVLRYRRVAAAPTTFCTVLYAHPAAAPRPVQVTRVRVQEEEAAAITSLALRIDDGRQVDHVLLASGRGGARKHFGDFTTDAEVALVRQTHAGELLSTTLHNGSRLDHAMQPLTELDRHA